MTIFDLLNSLRGFYLFFEVWFQRPNGSFFESYDRSWAGSVDRYLDTIAPSEVLCSLDITDSHISLIFTSHRFVQIILKLSDGEECYFD